MHPPPATDAAGLLSPEALAATYDTPGQLSAWNAVEQYHRVMRVASRHPNKGSGALSSIVDLPRERIRTWVDRGGAPDVVRGLNTAAEHGWFDNRANVTIAWATLVAGILGGGSIATEHYRPQWTITPYLAGERVTAALETLNVGATVVERDGRATQLQPEQDASLLGRALRTLGAPVGSKNSKILEVLPEWLFEIDVEARRAAVELLVLYRGQAFPEKDTVELFETRCQSFRESVAALIKTVVDGTVNPGSRYVIISAAAARELGIDRNGPLRSAIE